MRIRSSKRQSRWLSGGTYAAGWSQGAIDVEEDDGVLDWAGLKRRVDCCGCGHCCELCWWDWGRCAESGGFGPAERGVKVDTLQGARVGQAPKTRS